MAAINDDDDDDDVRYESTRYESYESTRSKIASRAHKQGRRAMAPCDAWR